MEAITLVIATALVTTLVTKYLASRKQAAGDRTPLVQLIAASTLLLGLFGFAAVIFTVSNQVVPDTTVRLSVGGFFIAFFAIGYMVLAVSMYLASGTTVDHGACSTEVVGHEDHDDSFPDVARHA
ncbi:hypothetical protein [Arthrobacter methylotrophus]|uniref:Uncharacterized protein n=1 Tax=Arthrobacter methylotrophus TaxID=121291 RepID=A0ABV5UNE5_9MICC